MRRIGQWHLLFVRCGSILVQRGIELRLDSPPPSLGVSSLDLGRRLADGPFFCVPGMALMLEVKVLCGPW